MFCIINTKLNAVRISEIELCDIPMQMTFAVMLIDAFHAAFKHAVKALNGVSGDFATHYSFSLRLTLSCFANALPIALYWRASSVMNEVSLATFAFDD
jgi:hypothetical protein